MERKWWTRWRRASRRSCCCSTSRSSTSRSRTSSDLDASLSSLQWVVDAYALTLAAFLLTTGSLGDRLGRRRVFNIGFGVFTTASLLCGISGDATLLNLARGLQGSAPRRCSPPRWR